MDKRQKASKNKNNKAKNGIFVKSLISKHSREDINALVLQVLETVFEEPKNPKEEWDQHCKIRKLLASVMALEAPIQRSQANATPEQRLVKIETFYRWARENGVRCDGVRIALFPGYDLGLAATRDIAKNEPLFAIPRKLIFSEESVEADLGQFGSMTNIKLAYTLMVEYLRSNSFWKPYIDLLPQKYNTILYFTLEEMEELRGTTAFLAALRHFRAIARQYAFIYNISRSLPHANSLKEVGAIFKERFCYDLYRWSVSTVMTRENLIPRCSLSSASGSRKQLAAKPPDNGHKKEAVAALIPFWDMANHQHGKLTSFYNEENHEMESFAQADFKKGEQIFIHYGERPNVDLLLHNGFINPNHPKDSVAIKLGVSTSDALYEIRCKLLGMLHIQVSGDLKVLAAPEYISPELLAFVRVFNMNAEQLEHWISAGERAKDLLHLDCALETSLEKKTWEYLQTRLMLLLRVYPTTLEADEQKLSEYRKGTLELSGIQAMLLEYRVLEKRILSAALDYAKQRTKT